MFPVWVYSITAFDISKECEYNVDSLNNSECASSLYWLKLTKIYSRPATLPEPTRMCPCQS